MVWFRLRESIETWIGLDGTLRQRVIALSARFASASDRARWLAAKQHTAPRFSDADSITRGDGWLPPQFAGLPLNPGDGLFSYQQLMSLPSSVPALRTRIDVAEAAYQARLLRAIAQARPNVAGMQSRSPVSAAEARTGADLQAIEALLATPVPTRVRAALFRVAATLPGVAYAGRARDPSGRAGVAISLGRGVHQGQLIFDPDTGELLANVGTDFAGTIVAQGVVGSIDRLPRDVAPVPEPAGLEPQVLGIAPRIGGRHTVFRLQVPAPRSVRRSGTPRSLFSLLFGPEGPGCRSSTAWSPLAQIPQARYGFMSPEGSRR